MIRYRNINEQYGDRIVFDSLAEMEAAIRESGYEVPQDGLQEERDYEEVCETSDYVLYVGGNELEFKTIEDARAYWNHLTRTEQKRAVRENRLTPGFDEIVGE